MWHWTIKTELSFIVTYTLYKHKIFDPIIIKYKKNKLNIFILKV